MSLERYNDDPLITNTLILLNPLNLSLCWANLRGIPRNFF